MDLSEVRKRLQENPLDAGALCVAGRYYLQAGCYQQAQKTYLQAQAAKPACLSSILLDYEAAVDLERDKIGPRLSLAGFLLNGDSLDQAIMELEETLETEPHNHNVEAYNVLGRLFIKAERLDDAIELLERSLQAGVKDVSLTEILAGAYLGKGRMAEATKFYEEILRQKPTDKQTLRILGELYVRQENYNQAANCYRAMFSDDPEVAHEVTQRLEDILKKVEGNIVVREILAEIHMKMLNPEAAVKKLTELIRLEPDKLAEVILNLRNILKNYPQLPVAALALAEALVAQQSYSEAVENYNQLVQVKPEMIEEVIAGYRAILVRCPDQVFARLHLGEALLRQGKDQAALQAFSQMIEDDPTVAEMVIRKCREVLKVQPQLLDAHIVLGQAYLAKGDYQRAVIEAEGAVALDTTLTSAYLLLGQAYTKQNLPAKATAAIHKALMLDPYNLRVHDKYRLAKEQEVAEEIRVLQARLNEDQWKFSLHYELARLYLVQGKREDAIRELQLAQRDSAKAPQVFNLLGNIYRLEGHFDLAAAQYSRALELAPPELVKQVQFNLGSIFEAQGEVRKAIKVYETILQEDLDFGNLAQRVKKLKATGLVNMRQRPLQLVITDLVTREVIALWGKEIFPGGHGPKKEEVSVSFGQEHNSSGFDYFMKGMCPAAEEEFSLAVQLDRRFGTALNNLGVVLGKTGRLEEARLKLAEAIEYAPTTSLYYNNLGVVLALLGKLEPAAELLEKSLALDPGESATCLNLGDVYYARKEAKRAIELYRQVGACDPLTDLANQKLLYKAP